jgi:hypothetical protein
LFREALFNGKFIPNVPKLPALVAKRIQIARLTLLETEEIIAKKSKKDCGFQSTATIKRTPLHINFPKHKRRRCG